ncbi:MAG TPA: TIGR03564 family F420-dependent LLM class oxidoreductase [Acidimicrobiales bacterium]|nr:TIGR03564 family F420-dependent LLM class oxidoreductase [Acidimicrobiales bacterium]
MKIGLSAGGTFDRMVEQVQEAEADGFDTMWFAGGIGMDPLTVIAAAGRATDRIELGTSIVPTYPRHPTAMAQQTAAVQAAIGGDGNRFTLGIGVSHKPAVEDMLGIPYDRPGKNMREYLSVLRPLLHEGKVSFDGEFYNVRSQMGAPAARPAPVLVAALAPVMLQAAGALAEGTITWMANAKAIESHISPLLRRAAADAGRDEPRIVVGLPVAVCDDASEGRSDAAKQFAGYGTLPNYQRVLAHGGCEGPGDAAVIGDEASVRAQLQGLLDAGGTDVWAAVFPVGGDRRASRTRTRALLQELAATSS